ncbi:MAG: YabP/YqfC family sporulation protein [Lachnospiraceae bacterium]|nr:YabP/YqfC family sporulation protein [Lachnospiraceae bacterium]
MGKEKSGHAERESILLLTGQLSLQAENYRGILEVTPERIVLQARRAQIAILGQNLQMEYYAREELRIVGRISRVEFLQGGGV